MIDRDTFSLGLEIALVAIRHFSKIWWDRFIFEHLGNDSKLCHLSHHFHQQISWLIWCCCQKQTSHPLKIENSLVWVLLLTALYDFSLVNIQSTCLLTSFKVKERLENSPQHIIFYFQCVVGIYPLIKGNALSNNKKENIIIWF